MISDQKSKITTSVLGQSVTIIGSGISGIMTAWQLAKASMKVTLYSKSPDPSVNDSLVDYESSTFDSKNDQRYITLFEGHPYLELDGYVDKMYPGIADDFNREVLDGGLLAVQIEKYTERSVRWLEERAAINHELRDGNTKIIEEVENLFISYTRENRAAMAQWYYILADLIKEHPELIKTLSLSYKGILRLYDTKDAFEHSKKSHIEEGVFLRELEPEELIIEYPAYTEGVKHRFIQGGAIEIHGLTFGVQSICKLLIDKIQRMGVQIYFESEVESIQKDSCGLVSGLKIKGQTKIHQSNHYIFHTGAFAGPELFESVEQAQNKLAAVEGYWITIENADQLLKAMGNKPNKVHGKKSLAELLSMIDAVSAKHYKKELYALGIKDQNLTEIAPIVDFNNMPINNQGKMILGVGSGYIFKGLAERKENNKVIFTNNKTSEQFTLLIMELWLEALHGKKLLTEDTKIVIHKEGCKRSWTPTDKELDINIPTSEGGLCMIHDGGNTGSTTKSPFIAEYVLCKIKLASKQASFSYDKLRYSLGKSSKDICSDDWAKLLNKLDKAVMNAEK